MSRRPELEIPDALPGAERQFPVLDGDRHARANQGGFDVRLKYSQFHQGSASAFPHLPMRSIVHPPNLRSPSPEVYIPPNQKPKNTIQPTGISSDPSAAWR